MLPAWHGGSNCLRPSRHRALPGLPLAFFLAPLGPFWVPLDTFWVPLGPLLGPPGPLSVSLAPPGPPLDPIGAQDEKSDAKYAILPPFWFLFGGPGTLKKQLKVCNYHAF